MRVFDIVGIVCVAGWVASVGAFVWFADTDEMSGTPIGAGDIDLREETNWMALYRDGEDAGALREDRTRLVDGWLIELQGIVQLDLMGDPYGFRFTSRTTLTEDLRLKSATGTVEAFGLALTMNGRFRRADDQPQFHLEVSLEDSLERFVADLDERPRLAIHAIPQILAEGEPEVGERFTHQFYDPFTLAPAEMELIYEGRRRIRTVDGYYNSYDFTQSMGTFDSRIHADDRGRPLMHIFPMQVVLRALPEELGPSHYEEIEEQFEDSVDDAPPFLDAVDPEDLLSMVARFGGGELDRLRRVGDDEEFDASVSDDDSASEPEERIYLIEPLPEDLERGDLDLIAPTQHVALKTGDRARVETGSDNPLWNAAHAPENSEYEPRRSFEVVEDAAEFDPMVATREQAEICTSEFPEPAARELPSEWPGFDSNSDSHIHCLAFLADSFANRELAPHFAHGAHVDDDGEPTPRIWLSVYRDGEHVGDFDPFAEDGTPGVRHVQLYLDDEYDPELLPELVDAIQPD